LGEQFSIYRQRRIEGGRPVTGPFDDRNGFASILCFAKD
jgi:hypothetical protein